MQYRIGARETIFSMYTEGKISYMEALEMAGEIKHLGDKSDTFFMLMNYENLKANPALWMGPPAYAKDLVCNHGGHHFRHQGPLGMFKPSRYLIPIYPVLALAPLGFFVRWRPRDRAGCRRSLAAIACFYAGILLCTR